MGSLNIDLTGRLRNFRLPHHRALVPLFEAIVNSLQAVRTRGQQRVHVRVLRSDEQSSLDLQDGAREAPITGFEIHDNGTGFTSENYKSFETSDSTYKLKIGGRGVGRLTWLKAYESVHICSVYDEGGKRWKRTFLFTERGIEKHKLIEADKAPIATIVTLTGTKKGYAENVPKRVSTLADRIVDHTFATVLAAGSTHVSVSDEQETVNISAMVSEMDRDSVKDRFSIAGHEFTIRHLKITASDHRHQVSYLANGREVRNENLERSFPQLRRKLGAEDEAFWWWSLVSSSALDDAVNGERDEFNLPESNLPLFGEEVTMARIGAKVRELVGERLEPYLAPLRAAAETQVRNFVADKAPEYRYLLSIAKDRLALIPPDLDEAKLDAELHRIQFEVDRSIREKGEKLLRQEQPDEGKYDEFLAESNLSAKAKLAQYIVHRRKMLDLFSRALELQSVTGKHDLESAVHKIIFPLQRTSDEVPYEQQNLWMIDERLAYHFYLASDKSLKNIPHTASDSKQRPDLIIFDKPFAFAEGDAPYRAIIIVEFKRPARDDYDEHDNPISQVYGYVRELRSGDAQSAKGRPLTITPDVPIYCYIVCDITSSLRTQASDLDLKPAPDRRGFFGYNANLGAYLEIISFEKLLGDAEKRNRILFDKLGLPKS